MRTIKIDGRNHIFSQKKNAINHECVMVTKSLQLGLQKFTGIINNCIFRSFIEVKFIIFESQKE